MATNDNATSIDNCIVPTEGTYKGLPLLAIPYTNPKKPIMMTVGKWRKVLANLPEIEAFVKKHANFDTKTRTTVDPAQRKKELRAELDSLELV